MALFKECHNQLSTNQAKYTNIMANHAENYFQINLNEVVTETQIAELTEFMNPYNLLRVYDLDIDILDMENRLITGSIISAWCEPIDAFRMLVIRFPFIESIRNQCKEEGCDYYSILKFDHIPNKSTDECFQIASL